MKQCLLCLDFSKENLCPPCKDDLPWVKGLCPACGRHSVIDRLCPLCQAEPPPWDRGVAPLIYVPPLVNLIAGLKFSKQFHHARTLTDLFLEALPEGPRPELLLPVPLHPWRMLWRGFNQSTELTRLLSQALSIPYSPYYLKRIKHSTSQRGSKKSARRKNVTAAFALRQPLPVSHIALIDDVLTTGETLGALCRMLRAHQPELRIEVWAMAQVVLG